jgi:hypothetical protein
MCSQDRVEVGLSERDPHPCDVPAVSTEILDGRGDSLEQPAGVGVVE